MKLFMCPDCRDIVRLKLLEPRKCECGVSSGWYHGDGIRATITGKAVPLGIHNQSYNKALEDCLCLEQNDSDTPDRMGVRFEAFVIPMPCKTIKVEDPFQ